MDHDETTQTENEETYRLTELQIESVGLVGAGANQENWFILKHDKESLMSDDQIKIEEPDDEAVEKTDPADPGLWAKIVTLAREIIKAKPAFLDDETEADDDEDKIEMGGKTSSPKKRGGGKTEARKSEQTTEGGKDPVSETVVSKSVDEQLAEIQKANEARLEAIEKALEAKYLGQLEAFAKQAEEAKVEVAKANEARETREWVEKAAGMTLAIGADQKELGQHLYTIAKAVPAETVEYIVSVLKAADHALTEGNLFSEFGTSQAAEQVGPVEKAQKIAAEKGLSLAEAMLELSPAEQAEIVKGFHEDGGKR